MKVIRDVPGSELDLQQSKSPNGNLGCAFLFIGLFWIVPLLPLALMLGGGQMRNSSGLSPWVFMAIFCTFWYGITGLVTLAIVCSSRYVTRLTVDRATGHLTIHEVGAFGLLARARSVAAAETARVTVGTSRRGRWVGSAMPIDLAVRGSRGREESIRLDVEGLDKREELLDFALRVAAAMGLPRYDVTRSDPREFEVVLGPEGKTPVPPIDRPANYLQDIVAAKVDMPREVVPSFDPKLFKSAFRVEVWEPGNEVRLFKPFQTAMLGCSSIVILPVAVFGGGLAWTAIADKSQFRIAQVTLGLAFLALPIAGLVGIGLACMPQLSLIEWTTRRITIARSRSTREIPFAELTGIETRGVRTWHRGGRNSPSYYTYKVQIWAHARDGGEMLAETRDVRDDPSTPYRGALPLGVDLAKALDVTHGYTDYK